MHASLAEKAEAEKKKLQEDTAKALKMIEAKYKHLTAEQATAIKETEDRIKAHVDETAEAVKGIEHQAGPLNRKVAAASGAKQEDVLVLDNSTHLSRRTTLLTKNCRECSSGEALHHRMPK